MSVTAAPAIVSRSGWGANPVDVPSGVGRINTPTAELWLHHTGSSGLHGASGMRSLQQGARNGGYQDLEYTLVVDTDGTIFMSRGIGRDTAATGGGHNSTSHAICCMGNFMNDNVPDVMLDAVASCVKWLKANGAIASEEITGPHRDASGNATACCGDKLVGRIDDINARARGASTSGGAAPSTKGGAVEIVSTHTGKGYWIVDSTGAVFSYGDAKYCGGANTSKLNAPIVGMAATPSDKGYWLLAQDGGVFSYGDAKFQGAPTGKVH